MPNSRNATGASTVLSPTRASAVCPAFSCSLIFHLLAFAKLPFSPFWLKALQVRDIGKAERQLSSQG